MPTSAIVDFFMVRPASQARSSARPPSVRCGGVTHPSLLSGGAILIREDGNGNRNGEVVQCPERLRLYSARGRVERCLRTHLGRRALWHRQPARRPAAEL